MTQYTFTTNAPDRKQIVRHPCMTNYTEAVGWAYVKAVKGEQ